MTDLWKKQIEDDMKAITDRLGEMETKLESIEKSDKTGIEEILGTLKTLGETKRNDSRWRAIGLFLLGGMSFIFIISFAAIVAS